MLVGKKLCNRLKNGFRPFLLGHMPAVFDDQIMRIGEDRVQPRTNAGRNHAILFSPNNKRRHGYAGILSYLMFDIFRDQPIGCIDERPTMFVASQIYCVGVDGLPFYFSSIEKRGHEDQSHE